MKKIAKLFLKETQGSYLFQYLAVLTANLNIISSGMHYGWPSPSLPNLLDKENSTGTFTLTNDQGSWVAVMPLMGSILGAFTAGLFVDKIGRKRSNILNTIPYFITWIMVAFSNSVEVLYTARFFAGVLDGWVITAVPMYIGEIADPKIRGFLGASVSLSWISGVLLINIIGSYFSIFTTAIISSAFPLLCLVTFIWMPESPYQLILNGNLEGAKQNMQTFQGKEDVSADIDRISNAIANLTKSKGSYFDLLTVRSNRRALFVMLGLRSAQQLSGITAITFYTQHIFQEAGGNISPKLGSIIFFTVKLIMCTVSSTIVDKAGRRPLLIISITGAGFCLLIEGIYFYLELRTSIDITSFSYIPVIGLILFVITFSLGMQSIPILMLAELFPTSVKAYALASADIYFSIVASLVSKFFQTMKDTFGMYVPFFAFSVFCMIGLIFVVLFVPETKGKNLEEIQEQLKGKVLIINQCSKEEKRNKLPV